MKQAVVREVERALRERVMVAALGGDGEGGVGGSGNRRRGGGAEWATGQLRTGRTTSSCSGAP